MFQEYLQKSTKKVLSTLEIAVSELASLKQNLLTPDLLLLALISQPDSEAVRIIEKLVPDSLSAITRIKGEIRHHYDHAVPVQGDQILGSQEVADLFRLAYEETRNIGDEYISTGTLFVAMCHKESGKSAEYLAGLNIDRERALSALKELRQGRVMSSEDAETGENVLEKYTQDLTEMARNGDLDPVIGREEEITLVIQTLSRRKKNNPALIGEAGVGKTVIVDRLAQRIADADVPDTLLNKRILSLDMG